MTICKILKKFVLISFIFFLQSCCTDRCYSPGYVEVYHPHAPVGYIGETYVEDVYWESHPAFIPGPPPPPPPEFYGPPIGPPGMILLPYRDRLPSRQPIYDEPQFLYSSLTGEDASLRRACQQRSKSVCAKWVSRTGQAHSDCFVIRYGCESLGLLSAKEILQRDDLVIIFAERFGISFLAATKVVRAFSEASKGRMRAFWQLGFTEEDLIAQFNQQPADQSLIERLSINLDLDSESVTRLLEELSSGIVAQVAHSNSRLWQNCFKADVWQTLDTLSCRQRHAPGCSPETGAKLCFVARDSDRLGLDIHSL